MRIAPAITLSPEQRTVLESQARSRSAPGASGGACSHRFVRGLRSAGSGNRRPPDHYAEKVSRWRKRFLALGVAGLRKTRLGPDVNPRSAPA